jgi:hypothetical protein
MNESRPKPTGTQYIGDDWTASPPVGKRVQFDDMLYLGALPVALQRVGVSLVAPRGRLAGYDNAYPQFRA